MPVILASGFRHSSTILRAYAANKKIVFVPLRSTGRAAHFGVSCCVLPELQTREFYCVGSFFVLSIEKFIRNRQSSFCKLARELGRIFFHLCQRQNSRFLFAIYQAGKRHCTNILLLRQQKQFSLSIFLDGELVGKGTVFCTVQSFKLFAIQEVTSS
ncbi:hypothetical protein [Endozoicomonas ascidiicola]|uniref:hypothetical protein n=1 Tax=Endozoicomonas ascidiicola TaxID=1698521 RepID=UPI0012FE0788|nr:hypothetical protein [Endozoicomonas ascidiicola]